MREVCKSVSVIPHPAPCVRVLDVQLGQALASPGGSNPASNRSGNYMGQSYLNGYSDIIVKRTHAVL